MKTFCLCLPEYLAQIEAAKKHFEEMGVGEVNFVYGVNADLAGLATRHLYEIDNPGTGFSMGSKPTGIWLGHLMLWTAAIQHPDEHFMFLECDAQFQEGWKEKFEQGMLDVPKNFDIFYPGHCAMEGHPMKHVRGKVFESKHPQCNHAYIVRRGVLPFLLSKIRKCWAPMDCQMVFEIFEHLKVYALVPRIIDQRDTILPP